MSVTVMGVEPARRHELALADERSRYSWEQLDPILNRAINALRALPLGETKRVAVYAPNSVETVIAYVAALEAGLSSVPVSFHLTSDEVGYILDHSRAGALLVSEETADAGLAAATGIGTVIGWRCRPREGLTSWEDWLSAASEDAPPTAVKLPGDCRPLARSRR